MNNSTRPKTEPVLNRQHRRGSIIVLTAVALVVMLAFAALLVDVAWMSTIQTEAQLASDTSARGALTAFVSDRSDNSYAARVARAQKIGQTIFENATVGGTNLDIDPTAFEFGIRNENGEFSDSEDFANAVQVNLPEVKSDGFSLFLAPLFGVETFNTSSKSTVAYRPTDVVLCLDISRSMAWRIDTNKAPASIGTIHAPPVEGSRWNALVDSVNLFLQKAEDQSPALRISLVTLGGGVRKNVDTPWDDSETRVATNFDFLGAGRSNIQSSIDFISSNVLGWQTPTREALQLTETLFANESFDGAEKITILLSDGLATTGDPTSAATALGDSGVTIHTIYFAGDPLGASQLRAVSDAAGGLALSADNEDELDNSFSQILALLSVSLVE